jgi:hypothetical protein
MIAVLVLFYDNVGSKTESISSSFLHLHMNHDDKFHNINLHSHVSVHGRSII